MEFQAPAVVACNISTLQGKQYNVEVETAWTVTNLREHMCEEFDIPEYEQLFVRGSVHLKSNDLVCFAPQEQQSDVLELILLRSPKPACFTKSRTEDIWDAFLSLSQDNGDTVETRHASQIARFAGMYQVARAIKQEDEMPKHFSFPDLLQYFSGLKITKPRTIHSQRDKAESEEVMLFDVGRTRCARLQAQESTHSQSDEADTTEDATDTDETDSETDSD
eukprot:TRINITY_DN14331_c0_g1_i1.p1 TRINITY_DN14331_c0_g1~~TRINITY_DN14331_c0_g1_i1.p1  ORF type:complete len:221 (-),score=44.77 TRINITY_DN14331_c0_g1_i1:244-906(-)